MTVLASHITRDFPARNKRTKVIIDSVSRPDSCPNRQLWQDFRAGSEPAFATIYNDYANDLYGYGMNLCPHREIVLDAIQDLFVSLWSSRANLGQVQSIQAYLYTSFRRKVIAISSEHRKMILIDSQDNHFLNQRTESSEQYFIEQEEHQTNIRDLSEAMAQLSDKQREIIYLRFYTLLGYDEIANIMSIDKKAAYNLMARTIDRLKNLMVGVIAFLIMDLLSFC